MNEENPLVLVIDDELPLQLLMKNFLSSIYNVVTKNDGKSGP